MAPRTSPHHNSTLLLSPSIGRTHRTLAAGDSPSYHHRDQCHLRHLTPGDGPLFYGDEAEETLANHRPDESHLRSLWRDADVSRRRRHSRPVSVRGTDRRGECLRRPYPYRVCPPLYQSGLECTGLA